MRVAAALASSPAMQRHRLSTPEDHSCPAHALPCSCSSAPRPGAAQTSEVISSVLATADSTIYGHTSYTPTLTVVPRTVLDTFNGVDGARVVDSVRAAVTLPAGLA